MCIRDRLTYHATLYNASYVSCCCYVNIIDKWHCCTPTQRGKLRGWIRRSWGGENSPQNVCSKWVKWWDYCSETSGWTDIDCSVDCVVYPAPLYQLTWPLDSQFVFVVIMWYSLHRVTRSSILSTVNICKMPICHLTRLTWRPCCHTFSMSLWSTLWNQHSICRHGRAQVTVTAASLSVWNSLPSDLRSTDKLKTFLFDADMH